MSIFAAEARRDAAEAGIVARIARRIQAVHEDRGYAFELERRLGLVIGK
jgi:hypothetical protein